MRNAAGLVAALSLVFAAGANCVPGEPGSSGNAGGATP